MMKTSDGDSCDSLKPIRIVVVGEKGTGKSSLIMAVATDTFHSNIIPLLPYINLPSEFFHEHIPAIIIDTSSREEDKENVIKEIKQADAIVLTFAFDKPKTFDRLSEYWLPLFRQLEVRVPIIVAGYKVDNNDANSEFNIQQVTSPIMQQYREIETSIEWTAHKLNQAREVIYQAQEAAIHPIRPIYDQETNSLKPRCVAALKRIFLLSDLNMDGYLNDSELNHFQVQCFNVPLIDSQSEYLRKAVQVRCPLGVHENGLTWDGFLFLITYFVEGGRMKKVWTILRKFGYNNDLKIADYMIPYSSFKCEADQSVELRNEVVRYLRRVFELFDEDCDKNLEPREIGCIFQTAPENPWSEAPYKDAVEKTNSGGLSLEAFLSLWSLMTLIDPAKSVEYLIYMRLPYDPSLALRVTRSRDQDRKMRKLEREVVQCYVFGPKNAGKSALLNRFIGRSNDEDENKNESTEEHYAVNMVAYTTKTLVMKEIRTQEDGFEASSLASCDVAIFVYDTSDESSWKKAIDLLVKVITTGKDSGFEFPCLMVAAKSDLDLFPMAIQESTKVTQELGIEAPILISSKLGEFDNLFRKILTAAEHPRLNIPEIESKKNSVINRALMVVSIGTAGLIIGLASFRLLAARKQS